MTVTITITTFYNFYNVTRKQNSTSDCSIAEANIMRVLPARGPIVTFFATAHG
jgi:hypothetical protein